MIELPEALNIAGQLNSAVAGKTAVEVLTATKEHKFCWYNGDPAGYNGAIAGQSVECARGFGIFAELEFGNGKRLCFNDGVNVRLVPQESIPKNYQLAVCFDDGSALVFTVAMYGGIILHGGDYDNVYYIKSLNAPVLLSDAFEEHYYRTLEQSPPTLGMKAFLATEQRFPGIGNGVLQDILFEAGLYPKRKISTLDEAQRAELLRTIRAVLQSMIASGGRDTEKNLFGNPGGYRTKMSKNSLASGCPICAGAVTKEAYLGGSVYYCPLCQHIE